MHLFEELDSFLLLYEDHMFWFNGEAEFGDVWSRFWLLIFTEEDDEADEEEEDGMISSLFWVGEETEQGTAEAFGTFWLMSIRGFFL